MENKINIAEILKDCPKGMELDCLMCDGLELDCINEFNSLYPIICRTKKESGGYRHYTFTEYGCYNNESHSKCVIFPKGKTTWEGFQKPFKDGDVVISNWGDIHLLRTLDSSYCAYREQWQKKLDTTITTGVRIVRFATEEEKQKLFDAIKANGYKWNAETKTLEKLIEPKFKVGDKIKKKGLNNIYAIEIASIGQTIYMFRGGNFQNIEYVDRDYELVPNKFDITTLKPFDKVLTRITTGDVWSNNFFGYYKDGLCHCSGNSAYRYCIPYEGNEHLLGTTNDCDDFYKTWK